MRLFVAVWPAPKVLDELERLARPEESGVRWTGRDQWHVTLRFLGEVAEDGATGVIDATRAGAAGCSPRQVVLGPATRRYGRNALGFPVAGVDDLAAAVGAGPTFQGHLTVARSKGKVTIPRSLEGIPGTGTWTATEIAIVRSHLGQGPAQYETLAVAPLGGPG